MYIKKRSFKRKQHTVLNQHVAFLPDNKPVTQNAIKNICKLYHQNKDGGLHNPVIFTLCQQALANAS
jgi:hypothetical protein